MTRIRRGDEAIHTVGIGDWRLLQDGRERGACVLDVQVDIASLDGAVAHERPAEMQPPLDRQSGAAFDLLGDNFGEQVGLGEIFRADDDVVPPSTTRYSDHHEQQTQHHLGRQTSLRSAIPSSASARSASRAAGIAPARISVSSTVATPRKM